MKTAEKILYEQRNANDNMITDYISKDGYVWKMIESAIKQAQKESWNEAVESAAKSADADVKFYGWGKECQLDASEYAVIIDKQSILKLKI